MYLIIHIIDNEFGFLLKFLCENVILFLRTYNTYILYIDHIPRFILVVFKFKYQVEVNIYIISIDICNTFSEPTTDERTLSILKIKKINENVYEKHTYIKKKFNNVYAMTFIYNLHIYINSFVGRHIFHFFSK